MSNGDEWISEQSAGGGLADEVAFEREFKMSSAVLAVSGAKAQAHLAAVEEAVKAGEEPPEPDGSVFPRSEWMAFFAWRQLRRAHPGLLPAKFAVFVEEVAEMEYLADEDEEENDAEDAADETDPMVLEAVALNGSGLDPTAPDRPPSPPQSSFSTASPTPISN